MESTEQNFSIDHFEEKLVTYSPVVQGTNHQEKNGSQTSVNDNSNISGKTPMESTEKDVNKSEELLSQEKNEEEAPSSVLADSEIVAKEREDRLLEAKQMNEVLADSEIVAKEREDRLLEAKQMNEVGEKEVAMKDLDPTLVEKSESNLLDGSNKASKDQSVDKDLLEKSGKSEADNDFDVIEIGRIADKYQILEVSKGSKVVVSDDMTNEVSQVTVQCEIICDDKLKKEKAETVASEMTTHESGSISTAENILNADVKEKKVETKSDENKLMGSELNDPSDLIDAKTKQAVDSDLEHQVPESSLVEKLNDAQPMQKEEKIFVQATVPPNPPIEVERKFHVKDFDENKLFQASGELISESSFEDVYYDNSSYDLILNDCWLRKRNGKWEFKTPINKDPSLFYTTTEFQELSDEKDIQMALCEIMKADSAGSQNKGIIEEFELKPFGTFTSMRKLYKLPFDCNVVIEFTSFGYSVGEIEMLVGDNSQIPEAVERIDSIAGQLGFQTLSITKLAEC